MRIFFLFIVTVILFGCHQPEKHYPIPGKKDINEIVKTVITQQTCVVLFDDTGTAIVRPHWNPLDSLTLLTDLKKVTIDAAGGSYGFYSASVDSLLSSKNPSHFNKTDSLYILEQYYLLKHFEVDTTALKNIRFINNYELKAEELKHKRTVFYELSIPIFSLDQRQAFVILNRYAGGGMGFAFILKKINGRWEIVRQWYTWMT